MLSGGGAVCVCEGPWGGATCGRYVGHDHDCEHERCGGGRCVWSDEREYGDVAPRPGVDVYGSLSNKKRTHNNNLKHKSRLLSLAVCFERLTVQTFIV